VEGFVESVGFGRNYRPDLLDADARDLKSKLSEPAEFDVVIEQEDLDSDTVVYRRRVTLNANAQTSSGSTSARARPAAACRRSQAELQRVLRVTLTDAGRELVTPLPLTTPGRQRRRAPERARREAGAGRRGQEGTLPGVKEYDGALGSS
jgi:hypothetical protein